MANAVPSKSKKKTAVVTGTTGFTASQEKKFLKFFLVEYT